MTNPTPGQPGERNAAEDARKWAQGFEDSIEPDMRLAVMPVSNLRLLIADLRRLASACEEREAENARLREALKEIARYDDSARELAMRPGFSTLAVDLCGRAITALEPAAGAKGGEHANSAD